MIGLPRVAHTERSKCWAAGMSCQVDYGCQLYCRESHLIFPSNESSSSVHAYSSPSAASAPIRCVSPPCVWDVRFPSALDPISKVVVFSPPSRTSAFSCRAVSLLSTVHTRFCVHRAPPHPHVRTPPYCTALTSRHSDLRRPCGPLRLFRYLYSRVYVGVARMRQEGDFTMIFVERSEFVRGSDYFRTNTSILDV